MPAVWKGLWWVAVSSDDKICSTGRKKRRVLGRVGRAAIVSKVVREGSLPGEQNLNKVRARLDGCLENKHSGTRQECA